MGFYLGICDNSMKYKNLDSRPEDQYVICIHIEKNYQPELL